MKRDLHTSLKLDQVEAAQAITTTDTSATIDTRGADSVEVIIAVGVVTNIANSPQPTWAIKLQSSPDDSAWTDVTDSNHVLINNSISPVAAPNSSTGVFCTIDGAADDAKTFRVGYVGGVRYIRVVATAANTPGSTPYFVCALLGHLELAPAADTV